MIDNDYIRTNPHFNQVTYDEVNIYGSLQKCMRITLCDDNAAEAFPDLR